MSCNFILGWQDIMTRKIKFTSVLMNLLQIICNEFTNCGACIIIIQEDPLDVIYICHNLNLNSLKDHLSMLDLMSGMTFLIV